MSGAILIVSYLCLLIFIVESIKVWRRYARMPLHLRWELHPTPKEEVSGGRESDPPAGARVLLAEVRYAAREGLLFERCFISNRGLWYFTYPFHIGVFLGILWFVLLPVKAAFLGESAWWPARFLDAVIIVCGAGGLVLGSAGCIGLMVKRIFDPNLSPYTSFREYLNLGAILFAFLFGFASWIGSDPGFSVAAAYVRSLITVSSPPPASPLFYAGAVLLSLFVAFLPFSSLRHGIAKFFTYHRVRWDDEPNVRGSALEARIKSQLSRPVTWSASHVNCATWVEAAEMKPVEKKGDR